MPLNPLASEYYSEKAKEVFRRLFPPRTQDPSIEEEQDRIIRKAADYDVIEPSAGWGHLLEYMLTVVNQEIAEATSDSMNPEKQRLHVIRWNAMRELLDGTLSEIKDTRKERDRIIEDRRADERND